LLLNEFKELKRSKTLDLKKLPDKRAMVDYGKFNNQHAPDFTGEVSVLGG